MGISVGRAMDNSMDCKLSLGVIVLCLFTASNCVIQREPVNLGSVYDFFTVDAIRENFMITIVWQLIFNTVGFLAVHRLWQGVITFLTKDTTAYDSIAIGVAYA